MPLESPSRSNVARACERWQTGRDGGSSLLRGGARVLTGIPHYFAASFIEGYEQRARDDDSALGDAAVLLKTLVGAEMRDASAWCAYVGLGRVDAFAGRGLTPKPEDDQILERLDSGNIDMPLWGVSLDRTIADSYGTRFLFELQGPFPAIAAWLLSGIKAAERELITGGRYVVDKVEDRDGTTYALLRWASPLPAFASAAGTVRLSEG